MAAAGGERFDAVIVGAGLSGLSLAAHLATGGWQDRSVLVVDDGGARAATGWASWSATPGLLDDAVSRRYGRVRVHACGRDLTVPLGRYSYRLVRRADLHRTVTALLADHSGYRLRRATVTAVRDGPAGAEVFLDGEVLHAGWAFDSRYASPPDAGDGPPGAGLAFTGWEVHCARPVFDPEVPTLIDFRVRQLGGACFGYVLPLDGYRALVEYTAFVPRGARPPARDAVDAALAGYLRDVLGAGEYRVERVETGVLPLRTARSRPAGRRVLAIGARGGLIKASTGYAYGRIQRDSAAIAASLASAGHPFGRPVSRWRHRTLDALLLDVLAREPDQLQPVFARMFAANPAERVLAFLDEDTRVVDEARLVATLSPGPFVRAVAATAVRRC